MDPTQSPFGPRAATRPNQIMTSGAGHAMNNMQLPVQNSPRTSPSTPDKFISHAHVQMEIKSPSQAAQDNNNIEPPDTTSQGASPSQTNLNNPWPTANQSGVEDDHAYTQALLLHQKARMEKLINDLNHSKKSLSALRMEVGQLEQGRKRPRSNSLPLGEGIQSMRESNRKLQVDIQLLTREIDQYSKGQTPLGVINPREDQHFYENIFNGPQGPLYQSPKVPNRPPPLPRRPPRPPATHPPPPPRPPEEDGDNWNCSACTFLNHPALDKCECCEMPRISATSVA